MKFKRFVCLFLIALIFIPFVFAGEDSKWFKEDGLLFVVNKDEKLRADYKPQDLRLPKVDTRKESLKEYIYLKDEAALALEEMFNRAAIEKGFSLYAVSGYRTYGIQQINFNQRLKEVKNNRAIAEQTVAPAGASEHQTGLAMDIQAKGYPRLDVGFAETEEGKWLENNAHKYGFILRYKKEFADITRFSYEPWHFRYVGRQHAGAIYSLNVPLEEYRDIAKKFPDFVLEKGTDLLLAGLFREVKEGNTQTLDMLLNADDEELVLEKATEPFLKDGESYDKARLRCYPELIKQIPPPVYEDDEVDLFG